MTAVLWFASILAAATPFEECQRLDQEFDTKAMVAPCAEAAADSALPSTTRSTALRLLGFAQVLNGNEDAAQDAFVQMLVLAPNATLPVDAGAKITAVFERARARVQREGAITGAIQCAPEVSAGDVPITVDVRDPLHRIHQLRVVVAGKASAPFVVAGEAGGKRSYRGTVSLQPADEVTLEAQATDVSGGILEFSPPVELEVRVVPADATTTAGDEGDSSLLWYGLGAGGAVAVIGAAVGGGVAAWCFAIGPCRTQDAWVRVRAVDAEAQ